MFLFQVIGVIMPTDLVDHSSGRLRNRGFTLIELIIVLVLIGIVGAMVGTYLRGPIDAYISTARRAELTDIADTTLRRIAEDIHGAVPASVRASSDGQVMEMVLTKGGGSFTPQIDSGGSVTALLVRGGQSGLISRSLLTSQFDIALYNDYNDCPTTDKDYRSVYCTPPGVRASSNLSSRIAVCTSASATGSCATGVTGDVYLRPQGGAGLWSPTKTRAQRFQIIDEKVAYVCSNGVLYRFSGYDSTNTMTSIPSGVGSFSNGVKKDIMATNVICGSGATYFTNPDSPPPPNASEIVHMRIQLQHQGGESVLFYHDVMVINGT